MYGTNKAILMQMQQIFKNILFLLVLVAHLLSIAQEGKMPRSIVVYKTLEPIVIDGLADEGAWDGAEVSKDFIDIEGAKTPTYRTNVRMLWDETYLYFHAQMEEPHVWATLKQRDTVI